MATRARVKLTVEVVTHDTWGDDCSVVQVRKQGREAAVCALLRVLSAGDREGTRFVVTGDPVVEVVIAEDKP